MYSAASRSNDPAKTESRAHSSRCSGVHSSWLQPIAVRSVRWRPGAPRWPPVSSRKRSSSRSSTCSTDRARSRPAASSSASGIPSRRWQSSRTVSRSASVGSQPGRTPRARSVNSSTASPSRIGASGNIRSPATRSGQRPAASTWSPGARRSSSATRAHASTRCSKPSITSSVRRSRRCSTRTARGVRLVWSASSMASIRACSSRTASRTADSSAIRTPSQYRFSRSAAARMTHRVLPTPATPTTVTSRASRSSSAPIPASSSARPTKGFSSAGEAAGSRSGAGVRIAGIRRRVLQASHETRSVLA